MIPTPQNSQLAQILRKDNRSGQHFGGGPSYGNQAPLQGQGAPGFTGSPQGGGPGGAPASMMGPQAPFGPLTGPSGPIGATNLGLGSDQPSYSAGGYGGTGLSSMPGDASTQMASQGMSKGTGSGGFGDALLGLASAAAPFPLSLIPDAISANNAGSFGPMSGGEQGKIGNDFASRAGYWTNPINLLAQGAGAMGGGSNGPAPASDLTGLGGQPNFSGLGAGNAGGYSGGASMPSSTLQTGSGWFGGNGAGLPNQFQVGKVAG